MDNLKEIVSERIGKLISERKMSQKNFAEKCGLSSNTISQAKNHGKLSLESATLIAKACNTTIDYIFGVSDIESVPEEVFRILKEHIVPVWDVREVDAESCFIPHIRVSSTLDDYFLYSWDLANSHLSETTYKLAAKENEENCIKAIIDHSKDNSNENRKEEYKEYILVSLKEFSNIHMLDDFGIKYKLLR